MAECVHIGFEDVFDHRKATHGIAVQGEVAHGEFALVASREHHPPKLVGQRHQRGAPHTALQIFFGEISVATSERVSRHLQVGSKSRLNRNRAHVDAQIASQICSIGL